jgi:hypothetical protein
MITPSSAGTTDRPNVANLEVSLVCFETALEMWAASTKDRPASCKNRKRHELVAMRILRSDILQVVAYNAGIPGGKEAAAQSADR